MCAMRQSALADKSCPTYRTRRQMHLESPRQLQKRLVCNRSTRMRLSGCRAPPRNSRPPLTKTERQHCEAVRSRPSTN
eukprot:9162554-Alexandrium_andersonii.AAC.1